MVGLKSICNEGTISGCIISLLIRQITIRPMFRHVLNEICVN